MKKLYRIRKNEEFSEIIGQRHIFSCASFTIYASIKKENNSRVGISVSKKLGDAVDRNKIKRQVRMMFLEIYDFDNAPYDLICIVKAKYKENSFFDNKEQLEKLIKKVIIKQ